MSSKETILTAEGLKKLEDELENLRSVKRHEVAERIKVAKAKTPNMMMQKMNRHLLKAVFLNWNR